MKVQNRKGQVLLIAVMLLATVITVVMTIAFNSTTETQVSRLEVDSQKALAAAEAGVEAVIKQSAGSPAQDIGVLGQGQTFSSQGITGTAQVSGTVKSYFITPLLQKDEQYTLYLSNYPALNTSWTGKMDIYLVSETGCPSVEVTVVNIDTTLNRYTYNTCSGLVPEFIANSATDTSDTQESIDSVAFKYKTSVPIPITNGAVAFIKVLNGRTKLGFKGYNVDGSTKLLPIQGKTVDSEARTSTGVVKKVQLFQSFPQIPSSFFMTKF